VRLELEPIPVSAFTCVTACGSGNGALYDALRHNRSALTKPSVLELAFPTFVGEINEVLPQLRSDLTEFNTRNAQIALAALYQESDGILNAVNRAASEYGRDRVGVVLGTSTSGLFETESAYEFYLAKRAMPIDFNFLTRHAYQATGRLVQRELGLTGPCFAISTACSSSAKALAAAQRLINAGVCDAVLSGGIDSLCGLTLRGFRSLELISDTRCQPMDKSRSGISIGEAAGLLLLEKPNAAYINKPHLLAVGESSDAYHMSSPHPEGAGARIAMQRALSHAGYRAADIDYVNFHGTATLMNDKVESKAVYDIFSNGVPCSGTKGVTGHTLGAAGAIETIVALLALEHEFVPGTCGLLEIDPDLRCDIVPEPRSRPGLRSVMSNAFGFGGNNTSVIVAQNRG